VDKLYVVTFDDPHDSVDKLYVVTRHRHHEPTRASVYFRQKYTRASVTNRPVLFPFAALALRLVSSAFRSFVVSTQTLFSGTENMFRNSSSCGAFSGTETA
jgi:hypothetical protein